MYHDPCTEQRPAPIQPTGRFHPTIRRTPTPQPRD